MDASTLVTLAAAFALGLRHATDADHIVAVSTLASDAPHPARAARVGALWGLGHLLTVLAAGSAVILLRAEMGPRLEWALELGVAFVLIWLGVHAIAKCLRGRWHVHAHRHGARTHTHLHFHPRGAAADEHAAHAPPPLDPARQRGLRPLLVGMAHGLAGTAALALLVLTSIPSALLGVVYLAVFGAGALAGMAAFGMLLGWPLSRAARRRPLLEAARLAAGAASATFGAALTYRAMLPAAWPF